jgi:glutathione synthase/RimK-type ligase-like ATP-grasp enzyme
MIVLWGLRRDGPLAAVASILSRSQSGLVFLDQLTTAEMALDLSVGSTVRGAIQLPGRRLRLDEVHAIYLRPYDFRRIPAVARAGVTSDISRHAEAFDDALLAWTEVTDALVVNRSSAMASNNSKPYQSAMIRAAGFSTPTTLITNDPDVLRDFAAAHPDLIYKSTSGVRSIVRRLDLAERGRLADLIWCPTQFQAFVPGIDYRVHVVHDRVFVCQVMSDAVDYRYGAREGQASRMRVDQLPDEVTGRCRDLTRSLGLVMAGLDLRLTEDGEVFCFEVNPSPGFTFFENATGQPIAAAVADLLLNPPRIEKSHLKPASEGGELLVRTLVRN